jgi:hypothetical protein
MDGSGDIQHYFASGVDSTNWNIKHTMFADGTFTSQGSMRAPVFYDLNDTAYYGDFASTSRMNSIVFDNLKCAADQTYGFLGRNVYADTVNGRGSDPLELNYYDGGSVIIGQGVNGNKALYAGSLYDSGNRVAIQRAQSNWNDSTVIGYVGGLLAWKNYGNSHVIFDASQGTSPSGGGVNQTNATNAWTATYPTLMGWNGSQTYGVRVDSARVSDNTSGNSATTTQRSFDYLYASSYLESGGAVYGTIFYDNNDRTYYLDPNTSGTSLRIAGSIFSDGAFGTNGASSGGTTSRIFAPKGAAYSYTPGNITGAIKIRLPIRANDTMWGMKVRIYSYSTHQTSEYLLGNYSYSAGAWNYSATYLGGQSSSAQTVRFGNEGGYDCVWIGETSTGWSHPVVSVMDFMGGYSNGSTGNWQNNWEISIVSSFGTVGASVSPNINFNEVYAYSYRGNSNVAGTGAATYHPSGIYSTGTNWLYGTMYMNGNSINDVSNLYSGAYYATNWFRAQGDCGLYSQDYGGHFRRNASSSHGTWEIFGYAKGGYNGLLIKDDAGYINNYMHEGGNGGLYCENQSGRWPWYWHRGNVCLGLGNSTTSSSYRVYVNGSLYAEGDIVAYSDARKKSEIITIDNALDKVKQLRGVYYVRTDEVEKGRQTGVIAQEINEVLPEVVTYAADVDEYGVKYGNIVGVLIEAIKEQQQQIEDLKQQINYLVDNK